MFLRATATASSAAVRRQSRPLEDTVAAMTRKDSPLVGVGLRLPHFMEVAAAGPAISWFEVHPENVLANPHAAELLEQIAGRHRISLHSVGISVGSAAGVHTRHLERVRRLADGLQPLLISGHLAWSTHGSEYLNDLLPLPYTEEALSCVVEQVLRVQDVLGRQYAVENPASYFGFSASTMTEPEFLGELVARTGCGLLCDVSNIVVSAHNLEWDAEAYLRALPADAVVQFHLGGYTPEEDLLIDTHAGSITETAWKLYRRAVERIGTRPTLIEWDNDLPDLPVLLDQARLAERYAIDVETMHAVTR
jgi:hypothetical protein